MEIALAQVAAMKDRIEHICVVVTVKGGDVQTIVSEQTVGSVAFAAAVLQDLSLGPRRMKQAQMAAANQAALAHVKKMVPASR